jgi:hypothetical protein
MQQAQSAIETARGAGAERYATDEFAAAEDALKRASEAVTQRDYRLALNNALDARERAQNASKEAADRKGEMKKSTSKAIDEAGAALGNAQTELKAAEAAHVAPRMLAASRKAIADSEASVQKARTALGQDDFITATDAAHVATARLHAALHDLDAATATASRRKH